VIGGDGLVLSIAAASIIAKVTRDRLMCALALDCPGYGFESHKGYAVPEHLEALDRLGPTVHHRRFFAPVVAARTKQAAISATGTIDVQVTETVEVSAGI
jgi:ribonuclease HII